jgi:hypothetical protein
VEARNLAERAQEPYCIAAYEHNQQLMPASRGRSPVWNCSVILYAMSPCIFYGPSTQNGGRRAGGLKEARKPQ